MTSDHLPDRPSWDCAACEKPWPCDPAREALVGEYVRDLGALGMYMQEQLDSAAGDLTDRVTTGELFDRFLGWHLALYYDLDGRDVAPVR